jgi:hypothetical protein
MPRRAAALALWCVLLSGCVVPADAYTVTDTSAPWTQPGLYDRLPRSGERAGHVIDTSLAEHLPFDLPEYAARWGGDYGLVQVDWDHHPDAASPNPDCWPGDAQGLGLLPGSMLAGQFWGRTSPEVVRAWAREFLANVTAWSEEDLDAGAARFYEERQILVSHEHLIINRPSDTLTCEGVDLYVSQTTVDAPLRLEALAERLRAQGVQEGPPEGTGFGFNGSGWSFGFRFAERSARRVNEAANLTLTVAANDLVTFERRQGPADTKSPRPVSDEEMGRLLNETFAALDLGTPALGVWRFDHITSGVDV